MASHKGFRYACQRPGINPEMVCFAGSLIISAVSSRDRCRIWRTTMQRKADGTGRPPWLLTAARACAGRRDHQEHGQNHSIVSGLIILNFYRNLMVIQKRDPGHPADFGERSGEMFHRPNQLCRFPADRTRVRPGKIKRLRHIGGQGSERFSALLSGRPWARIPPGLKKPGQERGCCTAPRTKI